jgi:hypothetical protein
MGAVNPRSVKLGFPLWVALAACTSGPKQLYPGSALPPSEIATLEVAVPYETFVFAIDGQRTSGDAWSLLPGVHEVWVRMSARGGAPNVIYTGWTYCRMRFEALAGGRYTVATEIRQELATGADWKVTLLASILDAGGETLAQPDRCSGKRPDLEAPSGS